MCAKEFWFWHKDMLVMRETYFYFEPFSTLVNDQQRLSRGEGNIFIKMAQGQEGEFSDSYFSKEMNRYFCVRNNMTACSDDRCIYVIVPYVVKSSSISPDLVKYYCKVCDLNE